MERDDSMRKVFLLLALLAMVASLLAACGSKGEEEVVGELSDKWESMQSYKAEATLTLQTGQEPQEYNIEVWHKKPDYYRISLTNKAKDITQIILRNEEGVFVLTPHLNKSFRFQSSWPDNSGQVYLYESLIKDILSDSNRKFSTEGDKYVFETVTNYHNKTLVAQKIWLSKDLKINKVEVMDTDYKVTVLVEFNNMEFDFSFENDAFDMKRNMQGALLDSIPTMAQEQETYQGSFGTYYPEYTPTNVELVEEKEVTQDGVPMVVLRYAGDYHFSIIQQRPTAKTVDMPVGQPVDLGFTIGVLGEKSLFWTYDGVDFTLTAEGMPAEEMVTIAQSVLGQASK